MNNWSYHIWAEDPRLQIDIQCKGFGSYAEAERACDEKIKKIIHDFALTADLVETLFYRIIIDTPDCMIDDNLHRYLVEDANALLEAYINLSY